MALISKPKTFTEEVLYPADLNSNFDELYDEFNGNIDAANLKDGSVTAVKLASDATGAFCLPGFIQPYGGATAPTGWLLCDGASYPRATYPDLFTAIGVAFGSVDGTHFNVPNLKGKVPVGKDAAQTEFDVLGETGGAKTHTHTGPSHTHATDVQGGHGHTTGAGVYNGGLSSNVYTAGTGYSPPGHYHGMDVQGYHSHTAGAAGTGNTGSGSTLQPYVVLNYLIKT